MRVLVIGTSACGSALSVSLGRGGRNRSDGGGRFDKPTRSGDLQSQAVSRASTSASTERQSSKASLAIVERIPSTSVAFVSGPDTV